jgi:hypothetical protein
MQQAVRVVGTVWCYEHSAIGVASAITTAYLEVRAPSIRSALFM